ncbi:MAG: hypothetical protein QF464_00855 [Myxococcota bacterium]|nr:hypothetical protein [Myxococcota bacterium]
MLFHLNQVGVVGALAEADGPRAAADLAEALSLDERILKTLLEYVCGVDTILEQSEDGFALTAFGRAVIARYGKETGDGVQVNLFDVRTGAYGPVWQSLSDLLTKDATYGETVHRAGEYAERGLYTTGKRMAPALLDALPSDHTVAVEFGVHTGLLECVGHARPDLRLFGVDRNPQALTDCAAMAAREGVEGIGWIEGDIFRPDTWADRLPGAETGTFYTIHLHEFMGAGREAVVAWLAALGRHFPGWRLVAIEQPRLDASQRETLPTARWLYSQSNILIHHLIKNGQILYQEAWVEILRDGGADIESVTPAGYLDYQTFAVRLGGGR